ncbi:hypothetical protein X474_19480 [Dethiosulfatarculus sandiegensis]|uniref:Uncharacterized protein n=1 Tax=Dethiosulfatarculus sandiegensis TaxID=1429043 RepID=A0A0D2J2E4_9BACT|nr:hypothetical protein X474_19480 [Dethiosulfatarculus sandiegensis]
MDDYFQSNRLVGVMRISDGRMGFFLGNLADVVSGFPGPFVSGKTEKTV